MRGLQRTSHDAVVIVKPIFIIAIYKNFRLIIELEKQKQAEKILKFREAWADIVILLLSQKQSFSFLTSESGYGEIYVEILRTV